MRACFKMFVVTEKCSSTLKCNLGDVQPREAAAAWPKRASALAGYSSRHSAIGLQTNIEHLSELIS